MIVNYKWLLNLGGSIQLKVYALSPISSNFFMWSWLCMGLAMPILFFIFVSVFSVIMFSTESNLTLSVSFLCYTAGWLDSFSFECSSGTLTEDSKESIWLFSTLSSKIYSNLELLMVRDFFKRPEPLEPSNLCEFIESILNIYCKMLFLSWKSFFSRYYFFLMSVGLWIW